MTEWHFYPRPPRGGRQLAEVLKEGLHPFLSTPSARRATIERLLGRSGIKISIHALREEGDQNTQTTASYTEIFLSTPSARWATSSSVSSVGVREISIHALREEGDGACHAIQLGAEVFLSTPSARRATAKTEKNISAFVSL